MGTQKVFALAGLIMLQLLVCLKPTQAQIPCKIQHYSTEDGLSHDIVTTMYKDRDGFMWFGTWDGINRFDGHRFTSFKSAAGDSSQLKNDRIDQIKEDEAGHLWIKSYDGQVYQFDKRKEKYIALKAILGIKNDVVFGKVLSTDDHELWVSTLGKGVIVVPELYRKPGQYLWFREEGKKGQKLPSDSVRFFYKDKRGIKWLFTNRGIVKIQKNTQGQLSAVNLTLPAGCSTDFTSASERNDSLFFSTTGGQILIYESAKAQIIRMVNVGSNSLNSIVASHKSASVYATTATGELVVLNPRTLAFAKYNSDERKGLRTIYEDSYGDLWLQPSQRGVILFSVGKGQFHKFLQKNDATTKIPVNHFRVFEDNQHRVWSVLRDGGFGYYDRKAESFKYFYNEPGAKDRKLSNLVVNTFYDPAGVMWLHTDQRGVEKIIISPNNFKQELLVNPGVFKSDNEVRGLLCDSRGHIWVGAKSGKMYFLQNGNKLSIPFINAPADGIGAVYKLYEDSKGNIWIGTKEDGLYVAQPLNQQRNSYKLTQYKSNQNVTTIGSNQIYSLLEDSRGNVWIGSFDNGITLAFWDNDVLKFKRYHSGTEGYPKGFAKVRHMALDAKKRVWLATTNGLLIIDKALNGKYIFKTYSKQPGNASSLGNNDIQYIIKDWRGKMWLATSGGGLNLANEVNGGRDITFTSYTTGNGLANDYLLSCLEDRNHDLWIATKSSISRFNVTEKKFRNYNTFDGVPNLGFSEGACQQLPDGRMAFGTIQGLIYFDPAAIKDHPVYANLALTDLQVNNKTVVTGNKNSIISSAINLTQSITLQHDQNIISFDFTVLDYRFDNRTTYLYRLIGFDNNWQHNQNQRRATYTNLPPGDYTFEVIAPDKGLYKNTPRKSISITILPPPWKTWWAYLIYVVLLGAVLEICRRTAVTMLRLRQKIAVEKKLADLKLTFFTNVSHELRTPLTLIVNPVEQVLKSANISDDDRHYLKVVRRNANRMERFVNQLLDLRKLQSGKAQLNYSQVELLSFMRDIGECFSGMASARNIRFELHSDLDAINAWVDPDKLETVLYNVLGNAFKFSNRDSVVKVDIEADRRSGILQIAVADQGCGVPEDELQNIFKLYHESVKPGNGRVVKGTGIGLALAKDLVELHGGTISAINGKEGGLTVYIKLPLAKEERNTATYTIPANEALLMDNLVSVLKEDVLVIPDEAADANLPLLLLVEDTDDMREFLYRQLSAHYQVKLAANGEEGLKLARKIQPDLILSDVMMPKMDGIEMLDKLKCDQQTSHIPVILLSARSAVESQVTALEYGADYYITKPFNNDFLLAAVKNILAQRKKLAERLADGQKVIDLGPGEIVVTSRDEQFLQKVISIVEERLTDPDFNIDAVAEQLNMARPTFFKKFKSLTQIAPVEFVRDIRLKRAKQYLDVGAGNINEISYNVGFSSPKYFSTCFKTKFQVSPSDYLKLIKVEQEIGH